MYTLYLAYVYTKSRLVNYIAIAAIALCVMTQIVVMAVLDGMLEDYRLRIQGLGEQVRLFLPLDGQNGKAFDKVAEAVKEMPEVAEVTPVLQAYAIMNTGYTSQPVIVRAVDLDKEKKFGKLGEFVLDQSNLSWLADGQTEADPTRPGIIIGAGMADTLTILPPAPDKIREVALEFAPEGSEKMGRQKFRISTRYRSSIALYDEYFCYISLSEGQKLFAPNEDRAITMASVWLKDPSLSGEALTKVRDEAAVRAEKALGEKYDYLVHAKSSEDMWASTFAGLANENALMEIVMALISLASGFAIFAILYTLVAARIRDIGVLRSIGAGRGGVIAIFIFSGLFIGAVGALIGAVGGIFLSPHISALYEAVTGSPLYPPHLYGAKELYIFIDMNKVVLRSVAAAGIAVVAGIPAALWAGLLQPLEALRHE